MRRSYVRLCENRPGNKRQRTYSSPLVLAVLRSFRATNCPFGFNSGSSSLKSDHLEVATIPRGSAMSMEKINQKLLIREGPLTRSDCGSGWHEGGREEGRSKECTKILMQEKESKKSACRNRNSNTRRSRNGHTTVTQHMITCGIQLPIWARIWNENSIFLHPNAALLV
jgi:hypothetical protein